MWHPDACAHPDTGEGSLWVDKLRRVCVLLGSHPTSPCSEGATGLNTALYDLNMALQGRGVGGEGGNKVSAAQQHCPQSLHPPSAVTHQACLPWWGEGGREEGLSHVQPPAPLQNESSGKRSWCLPLNSYPHCSCG